ncbi:MAG: TonB-dependent receptor [Desulfarculales bacterium]|jgi:iron complex outermembrane receptor protein|nr:TonB-dependent receptor [Desulfarculales bacterium]
MVRRIVITGLLILAAAGFAQAKEEAIALPELTVTASRWDEQALKVPQQITIVERKQIEELHAGNIVDVLRTIPGLMIRDMLGAGVTASVDMRGFGSTASQHTLVLLDGRRLNSLDQSGVDFTSIPVDSIERIEVMHGASSVLYGDGAVGGVINLITREGKGAPQTTVEVRGGTYETMQTRGAAQGSWEDLSWFGQAHYGSSHGYRDNSAYRTMGASLNVRVDPSDSFSLMVDGGYEKAHYGLPGALSLSEIENDPQASNRPDEWAKRESFNLRGLLRKDWQEGGVLSADVFYRHQVSDSFMWANHLDIYLDNFGVQPKYVLEHSLGSLAGRVTAGLDYNYWEVHQNNSLNSPAETKSSMNSLAGYVLEEVNLSDDLIFSLGGRVNYAEYDMNFMDPFMGDSDFDRNDTQYAWSAGLVYNFLDTGKVYASMGRTFRYPLLDEYLSWTAFNPDLKPEYGMDYELGAQYTLPFGLTASLNFYWLTLSDEIAYDMARFLNVNLDDTVHRGFDLILSQSLGERGQHQIFASLAFQDVRFDGGINDGNRVPLVPEWIAGLGASVEVIEDLRVHGRLNFIGGRYYDGDTANAGEQLSAYATLDLGAEYTWENFTVFINAANLFDREYVDYGTYYGVYSGYPAVGTTVSAGVIVKF